MLISLANVSFQPDPAKVQYVSIITVAPPSYKVPCRVKILSPARSSETIMAMLRVDAVISSAIKHRNLDKVKISESRIFQILRIQCACYKYSTEART